MSNVPHDVRAEQIAVYIQRQVPRGVTVDRYGRMIDVWVMGAARFDFRIEVGEGSSVRVQLPSGENVALEEAGMLDTIRTWYEGAKPAETSFRVVAHFATGEGIERHSTDHTRYSDAAARFWQTVQLMPDDGKDVPTFPGGMRREGPDRINGGIWSVELEVVR